VYRTSDHCGNERSGVHAAVHRGAHFGPGGSRSAAAVDKLRCARWVIAGCRRARAEACRHGSIGDVLVVYNLRYPGQYYDSETALNYNYYRDYDPATGRYSESDPIGLGGGANTYAYVGGTPINRIDQLGLAGTVAPGIGLPGFPLYFPPVAQPGTKENQDWVNAATGVINQVVQAVKNACTTCPDCTPYAKGTIGYIGPHTDHDHFPIGRPHLNLFVVNQNPNNCKCFWNIASPDAASPPPQPEWVNLNGGFPPLSP
jgi:RHS repeat-associated protein